MKWLRGIRYVIWQDLLNGGHGDGQTSDVGVAVALRPAVAAAFVALAQLQDRPGQPFTRLPQMRSRYLEPARPTLVGAAESALQGERAPHAKLAPHDDSRRRLATLLDRVTAGPPVKHGHGVEEAGLKVLWGKKTLI